MHFCTRDFSIRTKFITELLAIKYVFSHSRLPMTNFVSNIEYTSFNAPRMFLLAELAQLKSIIRGIGAKGKCF